MIKIGNKSPPEHIAEAIIFLKKHLDENLTHDYPSVEDPAELWQVLKEMFDNQRKVNLLHALEDFQKVEDYNSAVLRIVSLLKYCGNPVSEAEMMNKTYNTFHNTASLLARNLQKMRKIRKGETRPAEILVAVSTANVEKLTIQNGRDLKCRLDPDKFLRVKKLKSIPPRSVRKCITDVAVKDIGPVPGSMFNLTEKLNVAYPVDCSCLNVVKSLFHDKYLGHH
uniref:Uncharacterized protein n=1 Tax=Brassica oleracea var. oleracea TaxID=109376 RepID=A0A0D3AWI3_BRAOL